MRLLLDTHTFLWFIGGDAALSSYARRLIEDRTNERLLSIASLWEMAIKVSLGRLTVPSRSRTWWRSMSTGMPSSSSGLRPAMWMS